MVRCCSFEKADHWAIRSNEFSNQSYATCLARLKEQVPKLRAVVKAMLAERGKASTQFNAAASLEKVHAIWRF